MEEVWKLPSRYAHARPLARGGMGELWVARDMETGREVVVKRPRLDTRIAQAQLEQRFQREQKLLTSVAHANIVEVVEVGRHEGQFYIVTPWIDGIDLRELLESGAPLSISESHRILGAICRAASHLHKVGILHRDLQPGNVLLGSDGSVKVTDFGIAVSLDDLGQMTQTGEVLGTADYMSPEQRHRLPMDERSDQFSIGAIAYQMLTGHRAAGLFPPPSELNARVPKHVDNIVMRSLSRDPDDRFASVAELRDQLESAFQQSTERLRLRGAYGVVASLVFLLIFGAASVPFWGGVVAKSHSELSSSADGTRELAHSKEMSVADASAGRVEPDAEPQKARHAEPSELSRAVRSVAESGWTPGIPQRPSPLDSTAAGVDLATVKSLQQQWAKYLGVPVIVKNSIGMEFGLIPPGRFVMGSTDVEIAMATRSLKAGAKHWITKFRGESPAHIVTLTQPSYLGRHEVRVRDFAAFVAATGFKTWAELDGQGTDKEQRYNWLNTHYRQTPDNAVSRVAIDDCNSFCEWLGQSEDVVCRLPTEAEWEYACRAGTRTSFSFGERKRATEYAWFGYASNHQLPVGLQLANPLGIFDMHGNVWEFVQDKFDPNFYDRSRDSVNPICTVEGNLRIHRGGSIIHPLVVQRSSVRQYGMQPNASQTSGFRVHVEIPAQMD